MRRLGRQKPHRGMALVPVCVALATLVAVAGLGVDLGRMLVEHRALRTRAKAAALRAALAMDGTKDGIEAARRRAESGARGRVEAVEFGPAPGGPWEAEPADPSAAKLARVILRSEVELTLIRAVVPESGKWVRAAAAARSGEDRVELIR